MAISCFRMCITSDKFFSGRRVWNLFLRPTHQVILPTTHPQYEHDLWCLCTNMHPRIYVSIHPHIYKLICMYPYLASSHLQHVDIDPCCASWSRWFYMDVVLLAKDRNFLLWLLQQLENVYTTARLSLIIDLLLKTHIMIYYQPIRPCEHQGHLPLKRPTIINAYHLCSFITLN